LKSFHALLESQGHEVCESLLLLLVESGAYNRSERNLCYKIYDIAYHTVNGLIDESFPIRFSEEVCALCTHCALCTLCAPLSLQFNQVSQTIWPAGVMLGDYAIAHSELVRGRRVLELGSGTGITALMLLPLQPASLLLTDLASALDLLCENLHNNSRFDTALHVELAQQSAVNSNGKQNAFVCELDWERCTNDELAQKHFQCDLIVAADVAYDPVLISSLLRVIAILLELNPTVEVLLCSAERNPQTFALLCAGIDAMRVRSNRLKIASSILQPSANVPRTRAKLFEAIHLMHITQ
jgi:predicted nicotinamide N-methyase